MINSPSRSLEVDADGEIISDRLRDRQCGLPAEVRESNANQGSGTLDWTEYFGVSRRKTEGEGEALFQSSVGTPHGRGVHGSSSSPCPVPMPSMTQ